MPLPSQFFFGCVQAHKTQKLIDAFQYQDVVCSPANTFYFQLNADSATISSLPLAYLNIPQIKTGKILVDAAHFLNTSELQLLLNAQVPVFFFGLDFDCQKTIFPISKILLQNPTIQKTQLFAKCHVPQCHQNARFSTCIKKLAPVATKNVFLLNQNAFLPACQKHFISPHYDTWGD